VVSAARCYGRQAITSGAEHAVLTQKALMDWQVVPLGQGEPPSSAQSWAHVPP
jgi:hypothetical protein